MLISLLSAMATSGAPVANFWDYLDNTAPVGAIANALGLGSLAVLFATDRVLTKGQHLRRMGDKDKAHAAEIVLIEKNAAAEKAAAEAKEAALTKAYDARIVDINLAHENRVTFLNLGMAKAEELRQEAEARHAEEMKVQREATKIHMERGDALSSELLAIAREYGETTAHLVESIPQVEDGGAQ